MIFGSLSLVLKVLLEWDIFLDEIFLNSKFFYFVWRKIRQNDTNILADFIPYDEDP